MCSSADRDNWNKHASMNCAALPGEGKAACVLTQSWLKWFCCFLALPVVLIGDGLRFTEICVPNQRGACSVLPWWFGCWWPNTSGHFYDVYHGAFTTVHVNWCQQIPIAESQLSLLLLCICSHTWNTAWSQQKVVPQANMVGNASVKTCNPIPQQIPCFLGDLRWVVWFGLKWWWRWGLIGYILGSFGSFWAGDNVWGRSLSNSNFCITEVKKFKFESVDKVWCKCRNVSISQKHQYLFCEGSILVKCNILYGDLSGNIQFWFLKIFRWG